MTVRYVALLSLGFLVPAIANAQEVDLGGQLRPRFEVRDPSRGGGGFAGTKDAFTSMRARLSADVALDDQVRVFVQLQDVRIWGQASSPLGDFNADNFDLHQGYLDLRTADQSLLARAGRQEVNLGGQRLIGAVDWTQQGQSFDGLRLEGDWDGASLMLLGFHLADATAATHMADAGLVAAHGQIKHLLTGVLEFYAIYHTRGGPSTTDQGTFGARWDGSLSTLRYRAEGYYQTGTRDGMDVSAFMFGARLGTALGGDNATVTLWYDFLSGDADQADGTTKVFSTLFATNHKFYGHADLFLNIPASTGGFGLQDLALKGSLKTSSNTSLGLDLHAFRAAVKGTLSSRRFADEADLFGRFRYSENLSFVGGASYVAVGDGLRDLGRLNEDMVWIYLMANATF